VTDYNHWGLIEFQSVTSGSVPYRIRWVKYEENNHDEIRSMVYTFVSTARYLDSQQHLLDTMKFFVDQYRIMEKRINGTALHGSYRDLKRFSPTALSRRRYDDLPKLPKFLDYLHHTIEMEEVPADELCDCGPLGLRIHNQLAAGDRVSTRLVRVAGTDGPLFVEKIYDSDEKFEKEMSIYRKLSHLQGTTIPYLHSVLVTDPFVTHLGVRRPGALFEYCCEAMLLKEWWDKPIAARSLPPSELRHRMQQVVVASVETLHGEGIAHTQLIDHLLVRPSDLQVTIISFTHCQSDRQSLDRDWIDLEALFSGSSSTMSQRSSLPTPFTRPHSGLAQWHPAKPISPT
jgi:serine/threonine protein kinase